MAQTPRPVTPPRPVAAWELLEHEDPRRAWRAFQALRTVAPDEVPILKGLGEVHLMLGHPQFARAYGERALELAPADQEAMALTVRSFLRSRDYSAARHRAEGFLAAVETPDPDLLAALGSALFRLQRNTAAAAVYARVVALEPLHAEAHLRLGSGLTPPVKAGVSATLALAVIDLRAGQLEGAVVKLLDLLGGDPTHPVAHRLLGEALFQKRTLDTMALRDPAYRKLTELLHCPPHDAEIGEFVSGYRNLPADRRSVVDRTMALFGGYVPTLVEMGGHHDLLGETDRTTDAPSRANLRGKRTFDGRVWDDVRGIGGLRAATGIEALDEVLQHGYDTFTHEIAHQVHLYALEPSERARISVLYRRAYAAGRFLDYYAATNEAEYFGQGVEAFASYGKRPGGESTHSHTRFELIRVDPDLHDFIAELVDRDPLDHGERNSLLEAAVAVALRSGREDDAVVAAELMDPGSEREDLLRRARRAQLLARSY